jgi:hypothetical protein
MLLNTGFHVSHSTRIDQPDECPPSASAIEREAGEIAMM